MSCRLWTVKSGQLIPERLVEHVEKWIYCCGYGPFDAAERLVGLEGFFAKLLATVWILHELGEFLLELVGVFQLPG